MRDNHVLNILEKKGLQDLSAEEHAAVLEHTRCCGRCLRAYRIAQISKSLLVERALESMEPSPFFQARVMAALRNKEAPDQRLFIRVWRAAGTLMTALIAVIIILLAVNLYTLRVQEQLPANQNPVEVEYSLDNAITDGSSPSAAEERLTSGQVIEVLFASEDADADR